MPAPTPHVLSGGQQQRVALARALAPEPYLVLLDEPFSGLDPELRGRVRDDAMHLLKTSGAATLFVTHNAEEAMMMADRVVVMREGRVVQNGAPEEIYCEPASPLRRGLSRRGEPVRRARGGRAGGNAAGVRGRSRLFGRVCRAGAGPARGDPHWRLGKHRSGSPGRCGAHGGPQHARPSHARRGRTGRLRSRRSGGHPSPTSGPPGRIDAGEGEVRQLSLDGEQVFVFPRD